MPTTQPIVSKSNRTSSESCSTVDTATLIQRRIDQGGDLRLKSTLRSLPVVSATHETPFTSPGGFIVVGLHRAAVKAPARAAAPLPPGPREAPGSARATTSARAGHSPAVGGPADRTSRSLAVGALLAPASCTSPAGESAHRASYGP